MDIGAIVGVVIGLAAIGFVGIKIYGHISKKNSGNSGGPPPSPGKKPPGKK